MRGTSVSGLRPREGWECGLPAVSSSVAGSPQQGHCPFSSSACVSPRHAGWQAWPQLSVRTGCSVVGPVWQ
eukprot:1836602-Heterocapsa_arctica.AAC.1